MEGKDGISERRILPADCCELRVSGRTVSGTVMRYGDVADMGAFRETFLPGSFGDPQQIDATINVMHQEARLLGRTGGGGLVFRSMPDALVMSATLPTTREADDTLQLVNNGTLRGLSVEFRAQVDKFRGDLREISSAVLGGLALVDRPAYQGSAGLEVRRMSRPSTRRYLWQLL